MSLSKESIRRLRIVKEAILAQPEFYKQEQWVSSVDLCGTTCCLAGWADFIFNGKRVHTKRARLLFNASRDISYGAGEWQRVACKAIGLERRSDYYLFSSPSLWPYPFDSRYGHARTPKQRARAAAALIEHFIERDGGW